MVAAVLALGDIDFVERPDARDGDTLTDLSEPSRPRLEAAARLLDVTPEKILSALTSRNINAGISSQVSFFVRIVRAISIGGNSRLPFSQPQWDTKRHDTAPYGVRWLDLGVYAWNCEGARGADRPTLRAS